MKKKQNITKLNPEAIKALEASKQHFLTANREDILALISLVDFIRETISNYDNGEATALLVSILNLFQLLLNVIIGKVIDPLRLGNMPADAGEILYLINSMIDEEMERLKKQGIEQMDPRWQMLESLRSILKGERKKQKSKKIKKIIIE